MTLKRLHLYSTLHLAFLQMKLSILTLRSTSGFVAFQKVRIQTAISTSHLLLNYPSRETPVPQKHLKADKILFTLSLLDEVGIKVYFNIMYYTKIL